MADHLRHVVARSGSVVRPSSIQTIAAFLDTWAQLADPPVALLNLSMERALVRQSPMRFRAVLEYPGVTRELVELFGQVSGTKLPDDIGRLFAEVEAPLAQRGFAPRHARLEAAARRIGAGEEGLAPAIFMHGFFKLSAGESALVAELAKRADLTISLPDWSGAERIREALLAGGFEELRVEPAKSFAKT